MILVVGATGVPGTEISRRLREQGKPVRGLVRNTSAPEKVRALEAMPRSKWCSFSSRQRAPRLRSSMCPSKR
jgi:nucleoside-diphosphate-sugar epimerase